MSTSQNHGVSDGFSYNGTRLSASVTPEKRFSASTKSDVVKNDCVRFFSKEIFTRNDRIFFDANPTLSWCDCAGGGECVGVGRSTGKRTRRVMASVSILIIIVFFFSTINIIIKCILSRRRNCFDDLRRRRSMRYDFSRR